MHEKALMTVRSADGPPTLEAAARQLGVSVSAVDAEYGVVLIDPQQSLYCVQVDAAQLPAVTGAEEPYRGPFAEPRIETFGPPERDIPDDEKKTR